MTAQEALPFEKLLSQTGFENKREVERARVTAGLVCEPRSRAGSPGNGSLLLVKATAEQCIAGSKSLFCKLKIEHFLVSSVDGKGPPYKTSWKIGSG